MNQKPSTFKQIQIIYIGLIMGQILMGVMLLMLMKDRGMETEVASPFNYVIPAAVVFGIMASFLFQKKQNESIPTSASIDDKLAHYRKWGIMKWAVAEGGNLIALILTFLFGNLTTFMWFGAGLLVFYFYRPNLDKFATDYQLSQNERESL